MQGGLRFGDQCEQSRLSLGRDPVDEAADLVGQSEQLRAHIFNLIPVIFSDVVDDYGGGVDEERNLYISQSRMHVSTERAFRS